MFDWIRGGTDADEMENDFALPGGGILITGQSGLMSGTHVASNLGWRAVDALSVGDKVLTFDNGMQTVLDIQHETLGTGTRGHLPQSATPVFVPEGALCNRCDLWLMPDQGLLIESESTQDALGDPFAVVPARALIGFRGICRRAPQLPLELTILTFAGDEVVYVEGGMLAHCPRARDLLMDGAFDKDGLYDPLDIKRARSLVECLMAQNSISAFAYDADEVASVA